MEADEDVWPRPRGGSSGGTPEPRRLSADEAVQRPASIAPAWGMRGAARGRGIALGPTYMVPTQARHKHRSSLMSFGSREETLVMLAADGYE